MRNTLLVIALVALAALPFVTTGCPKNEDGTPKVTNEQIKAGARVTNAVASEFGKELDAEVAAGELKAEQADAVRPFVTEIETLSTKLASDPRNFDTLTRAERRQLIVDYVRDLTATASRLDAAGALHLKSEKARNRFQTTSRRVRQSIAIANVILAALPPETATPEPSPAQ